MQNPATLQEKSCRASTHEEFSRICAVTTVAWLPAWVTAALVCAPPRFALHGWAMLLTRCAGFFLCTLAAGAAGLTAAWLGLRVKPAVGLVRVLLHALAGWIFLPALVLLGRTRPAWSLPLIAVAAAVTAASLRQMGPADDAAAEPPLGSGGVLPSFAAPESYEAQLATVHPGRAITIAACAWTALLLSIASHPLAAGWALALGTFLLLWHWFRDSGAVLAMRQRLRWLSGTAFAAWLVCIVLLLPWMLHGGRGRAMTAAAVTRNAGAEGRVPPHFTSVILWPPKQRVTKLYFPVTTPAAEAASRLQQPLEIPFDGPYLYFEPPDNAPGPDAHIAHGLPTEPAINLTSADGGPLFMRAQQHLQKPIDANCCAQLDVAVENADTRAGEITLGVLLTDTSAPGEPTAMLGFQSVAPAPLDHPVNETAHFATTRARRLRRFNQITVVVLPSWGHWRGAKIAIEGFTLDPH